MALSRRRFMKLMAIPAVPFYGGQCWQGERVIRGGQRAGKSLRGNRAGKTMPSLETKKQIIDSIDNPLSIVDIGDPMERVIQKQLTEGRLVGLCDVIYGRRVRG